MAIDTREGQQQRDITLPPDTYLYLQNIGKGGVIKIYKGPFVVSQSGQDVPVRYDPNNRKYVSCARLEEAVQHALRANEGDYIVLENPSENGKFPTESQQDFVNLKKGRKVVIPGPWQEALWPGQLATVVEGHRLRSNQYLVAIVYNADEAEKNWETGTVAKAQAEDSKTEGTDKGTDNTAITTTLTPAKSHKSKGLPKPDSFAVGTRIVIRGSDVSFYIPCTGVEVLRDADNKYVREAVTLEQLEYCCLIDESGKKEYPRGPAVVFPKPTQQFDTDSKQRRKFRPIELNNINGIHLKVTAPFTGPDIEKDITKQRDFKEGEELFVTGKTLPLFYPREELSIVEYGQGNKKHFSTAVPKGEGRYVIEREKGEINLVRGPVMLLPDPRTQILVRRVLSDDECVLWFPGKDGKGNPEVLAYNRDLREAMSESPSGRSGVVSEGDFRKRQLSKARGSARNIIHGGLEQHQLAAADFAGPEDYNPEEAGEAGGAAGTIGRGTKYTQPRQLQLNTKMDGAVRIEIYPGYAVLVVGSEGSRRVVEGPEVVLLDYDEKLGFMSLSTGKPKNTDTLYKTSYLCVQNNQVGDIVPFESSDHVKGEVKISLRVNFEAESDEGKLKWFGVDNYVKYLTDHVRSLIAGMAKRHPVADIRANYVNLIRDSILGTKPASAADKSEPLHSKRPGLFFEANGLRVVEVEVLDLKLSDAGISKLLDDAQHMVVKTNIEIDNARKQLEATKEKERIAQKTAEVQQETVSLKTKLQRESIGEQIELMLAQLGQELKKIEGSKSQTIAREEIEDYTAKSRLARAKDEAEQNLEFDRSKLDMRKDELAHSTDAAVKRLQAAKDGLHETLVALGRDDMAMKLHEALNLERYVTGDSIGSSLMNILSMFPTLKAFYDKGTELQGDGNGSRNRLKSTAVETANK